MTKIKICGLSCPSDIDAVNLAKPDFAGFIINYPKSRRSISIDTLYALCARLDSCILPVGVFVDAPIETVAALLNDGVIAMAQLHGHEDAAYLAALRIRTTRPILQALILRTSEDVLRANQSTADWILVDSGRGSGILLDPAWLSDLKCPYFLAGGLTPQNLPSVCRTLHPAAVDLSSGVETDGHKDKSKILAAVAAVRSEEPCRKDASAFTAGNTFPRP